MNARAVRERCRTILDEIREVLALARRLPIAEMRRDVERAMLEPEALYLATLELPDAVLEAIDHEGIMHLRMLIAEYRATVVQSLQD